jgi:hypothetical protein
MTNFKYKFNCLIKVVSVFFLYFEFATDLYVLYLIRKENIIESSKDNWELKEDIFT